MTDSVPIHLWIHPWLPLMKDHMESTIFPTIRFKLSNALSGWHPSDSSAKLILSIWRPPVFSTGVWDSFMCRNILPKLELVLNNELIINPKNQDIEPWQWVMSWQDLIPHSIFVSLIENNFFPKWLKVLNVWLNSDTFVYDEITRWYIGWKKLFSEELIQHTNIKSKLNQALSMMSQRASGSTHVKMSDDKSQAQNLEEKNQTEMLRVKNFIK
jgi:tuftelin-interacting protein 11